MLSDKTVNCNLLVEFYRMAIVLLDAIVIYMNYVIKHNNVNEIVD